MSRVNQHDSMLHAHQESLADTNIPRTVYQWEILEPGTRNTMQNTRCFEVFLFSLTPFHLFVYLYLYIYLLFIYIE